MTKKRQNKNKKRKTKKKGRRILRIQRSCCTPVGVGDPQKSWSSVGSFGTHPIRVQEVSP